MDDFFFSSDENQKLKCEEYIVLEVTDEMTDKIDKKIKAALNEIEQKTGYEKTNKRSRLFYYLLIIGALLLIFFSSRSSAISFSEAFSKYGFIFIISILLIVVFLPLTIIYNMKVQEIQKEKVKYNKDEINNNVKNYEEVLNKKNMISSGFIVEGKKEYIFLDCYFYECKNKLAFCDGTYVFEIPLDRLTICKNKNEVKFTDNIFDYNSPIIFKDRKNKVTSLSNYDIIVEGKHKLHLIMTEYHFDMIKKFLGD